MYTGVEMREDATTEEVVLVTVGNLTSSVEVETLSLGVGSITNAILQDRELNIAPIVEQNTLLSNVPNLLVSMIWGEANEAE